MVKAKKAKWRIEENTREGFTRYSIRKYSMGVASVAVLSGFFFLSGISVQASEIVAPQLPKQEMVSNVNSPTSRNQTNTEASVTNKNLSNDIPKGINEVNEASIQSSTSKESEEVKKDNLKEENSNVHRSARRTRSVGDNPDERTTAETSSQPANSSQPATSGQPETSEQPGNSQPGKYLGTKVTAYFDNNNNGKYDEGIDELISEKVIPPAENGANGAAGKDGRNGAELLSGIIAPTPEDGKNGDTYIDAATGDVYKKNNGTWNKIGNLRGPQGEKGQKGDKGENGKDGRAPKIKVDDIAKSAESAGVSSRSGIRITVYDDKNNNDEFDEGDTVLNTKDVYNGTDGRNGVDGQTPKVKAIRDEAKKQTTLTFYIDKDSDGNYTEGTDTLVQTSIVKDGQDGATGQAGRDGKEVLNGKVDPTPRDGKDGDTFVNTATGDVFVKKNNTWEQAGNIKGPKGDKGENGKDGFTPEVSVTDNHDGTHTITITQPEGRPAVTTTVKNGVDGQTPKVKAVRDETKKQTTLTFYIDKDGDGNYTEGIDTLVQTSIVKDGKDGKSPKVSVEDNGDGSHTITIINSDGTVTKTVVKDGKDGRDGKDGKCGCQDKPVTPSNDKPVPPVADKPEGPKFAMPEPPVHELPEYTGGVTPLDPPVYEKPEFNSGVPGMPTPPVHEVPEMNIPTPSDNGNIPPVNEVPREGKVPPTNGTTPPPAEVSREKEVPTENTTPVVPERTPVPETDNTTPNSYLPETGTQSDYIYIVLASGILMSLYVGKRQED